MGVPGTVRRFLDWERRVFLGEEDWEFPTTRDMSALVQMLDQRSTRRSTGGNSIAWQEPSHKLAVHATPPDRIEVFGHWSPIPRHFGVLYFDGRVSVTSEASAIVGRTRQPKLSGSFLLLCANFLLLSLLVDLTFLIHEVISCITVVDYVCDNVANAGIMVGLGVVMTLSIIALLRYVLGGAIFVRRRLRALLTDLAGGGASD